jgi:hypothetical protein
VPRSGRLLSAGANYVPRLRVLRHWDSRLGNELQSTRDLDTFWHLTLQVRYTRGSVLDHQCALSHFRPELEIGLSCTKAAAFQNENRLSNATLAL